MSISLSLPIFIKKLFALLVQVPITFWVGISAFLFAYLATIYSFSNHYITAYGDAESHLNIAKRVIDSITPGLAQLGGVWLPLPHVLMIPFIHNDFMWRTGLAGSIVSGIGFIISCIYLYKIGKTITKSKLVGFLTFLVFAANPNILYLQSTPMTEVPLITFFILSTYYFILYLQRKNTILSLILAAFFGFCATISRYDGWFLVLFEAIIIAVQQLRLHAPKSKIIGLTVMFSTLAFFGILCWFAWDGLILGDPLYFTDSVYSAKTQQMAWFERGQLPAYHNPFVAFTYYFVDTMTNLGVVVFLIAILGLIYLIQDRKIGNRFYYAILLLTPFIFNVLTLYLGQSIIFLPHLTPIGFDWRLFNARYGAIMMPAAAILIGYLFYRASFNYKALIVFLLFCQIGMFLVGYSKVISLQDGLDGLSAAKKTDADLWMRKNYDHGLVVLDDYARSVMIIDTEIPMQDVIYVGNKPYWDEEMLEPEKYATWIVMQKDDAVWTRIYENPPVQARLYKYFNKVYTSPEILIFKRNPDVPIADASTPN
jgi:hypothetical protein